MKALAYLVPKITGASAVCNGKVPCSGRRALNTHTPKTEYNTIKRA